MLRVICLVRAMFATLVLLFVFPVPTFAHSWQDGVEDMTPAEMESAVSALETTLETPPPEGWSIPEESGDGTFDLAIEFAFATDQIDKLDGTVQRILLTYDALLYGVINSDGDIVGDTDIDIWLDYIRPHDAPAVAPFKDRLDTLRASIEEAAK